jgi:splicing factor 3B subunit 3
MGGTESRDGEVGVQGQLYLNIGLHNGVLLRTVVDQVTGDLSDTRTRQDYT